VGITPLAPASMPADPTNDDAEFQRGRNFGETGDDPLVENWNGVAPGSGVEWSKYPEAPPRR
jgi:hypothetical protein